MGVERLFFNKNVQTAFAVGQARGVVLLAAAQHGLPVFEYGPHEVKMAVTGYGRATKDQVQRMVQLVLAMAELPRPDDAADALAVAVCTAHAATPAIAGRADDRLARGRRGGRVGDLPGPRGRRRRATASTLGRARWPA